MPRDHAPRDRESCTQSSAKQSSKHRQHHEQHLTLDIRYSSAKPPLALQRVSSARTLPSALQGDYYYSAPEARKR